MVSYTVTYRAGTHTPLGLRPIRATLAVTAPNAADAHGAAMEKLGGRQDLANVRIVRIEET